MKTQPTDLQITTKAKISNSKIDVAVKPTDECSYVQFHNGPTVVSSRTVQLPYDELADEEIGFALEKLNEQFHHTTSGLEHTGYAQCGQMKSWPRFYNSRVYHLYKL